MSKKILIASRHSIVRHGINLMIHAATPHTVIADERPLHQVAVDMELLRPDLVIVDMLGRPEDIDMAIQTLEPRVGAVQGKILLLLDPTSDAAGNGTLLQRVQGIVTSSSEPIQILKAIDAILNSTTDNGSGAHLVHRSPSPALRSEAALAAAKIVTPREKQVIELVRRGLCNKRIARDLGISLTTVRTHRQKLMAKLGLHNAVEIAQFAANAQLG